MSFLNNQKELSDLRRNKVIEVLEIIFVVHNCLKFRRNILAIVP